MSNRPSFFVRVYTRIRSIFGIAFVVVWTVLCSFVVVTAGFLGQRDLATKLVRGWSAALLSVFGIKIASKGDENIPTSGGGIVVFNHQSHFDIPSLCVATEKHIRFGAKVELFKIPFFGAAIRALGTLPIARENRKEVMKVYAEAAERFKQDYLFVLAPEGTRQKAPAIGKFKKGPFIFAINAGVPLVPAVLRGAYEVLPTKTLGVNLDAMSRTIAVEFLPPIPTVGVALTEVDALVERVRSLMVAAYEKN